MVVKRRVLDAGLFESSERLLPLEGSRSVVPEFILDVPESIPQLGYGSHQFFRYYGKFPSIVGNEIVARFAKPGFAVLDCYAGSGTTLVEAQMAGYTSYGVDINPLAVLACKVKTAYYDWDSLNSFINRILSGLQNHADVWMPAEKSRTKLDKWFSEESQAELGVIRSLLNTLEDSAEKEFVTVAFLAIVRRCSNAFDGEVRPHINKNKKPRSPLQAFRGKLVDMLAGLQEANTLRKADVLSRSRIADNREIASYDFLGTDEVGLLVAHPPYLNSFNYLQVFSLEFFWSEGMLNVWQGLSPLAIKAAEHRAWPATDAVLKESYYRDFESTIKSASTKVVSKGVIAVVVGDATIRGELEQVHLKMASDLSAMGLEQIETWYRTTHFGIGKYAYSHRADYHGEAEKKDAILFFRVP